MGQVHTMTGPHDIEQLAAMAYDFIVDTVLADLGWADYEAMFCDYRDRRQQQFPMICIDGLPLVVYQAVGGDPQEAVPLAAAWIQFLLSGRILDDVLDDEGLSQPWRYQDLKETVAAGLFAVSGANIALARISNQEAALDITEAFNKTVALAARAEVQSTANAKQTVETYFQSVVAKSGLVFATGVWAAARLAISDTTDPRLQALYDFGLAMGVMVQLVDDCNDLPLDVDQGYWTLPVLHSLTQTEHPRYPLLADLLKQEPLNEKQVTEIVAIIEEIGSLAWCEQQAVFYQEQAIQSLTTIAGIDSSLLINYVTEEHH